MKLDPERMEDCLIAERVEGFRRVLGPATDAGGPCDQYEVRVPPWVTGEPSGNVFAGCPPRGAIAPYYWTPEYGRDLAACMRLVSKVAALRGSDVSVTIEASKNWFVCRVNRGDVFFGGSRSLAEAIRGAMLRYAEHKERMR